MRGASAPFKVSSFEVGDVGGSQGVNTARKRNDHIGSTFESYLAATKLLGDVIITAMKRVLVWQISQAMTKQKLTKSGMAARMKTSRAALDRLLDAGNTSVTLSTMSRAAAAPGKEMAISFK